VCSQGWQPFTIDHRMKAPLDRRRGEGRVAFLAHREEVRAALLEGWPRTVIHERLRDKLRISYPQFMKYVDRYLPDALPDRLVLPCFDPGAPRSQPAPRARNAADQSARSTVLAPYPAPSPASTQQTSLTDANANALSRPAAATHAEPARFVYDPKPLPKDRLI
jgi:hypothetical protein